MSSPTAAVLELLRERNRHSAPGCSVTRSYQTLLANREQLQGQCARHQQRLELLTKENHVMAADLQASALPTLRAGHE